MGTPRAGILPKGEISLHKRFLAGITYNYILERNNITRFEVLYVCGIMHKGKLHHSGEFYWNHSNGYVLCYRLKPLSSIHNVEANDFFLIKSGEWEILAAEWKNNEWRIVYANDINVDK